MNDSDLFTNNAISSNDVTTTSMINKVSTTINSKDRFLGKIQNYKGFNHFDTKFDGFLKNGSTKNQNLQYHYDIDETNFADFSNANVFTTIDNMKSQLSPNWKNKKITAENIKFQKDYSKNEQFDADLQEALKRSLVDQ